MFKVRGLGYEPSLHPEPLALVPKSQMIDPGLGVLGLGRRA